VSQTTTNYGFTKPELTDVPDITVLSQNWEMIDSILKSIDMRNKLTIVSEAVNANNYATQGVYFLNNASNVPSEGRSGLLFVEPWSDSLATLQFWVERTTHEIYLRVKDYSWSAWSQISTHAYFEEFSTELQTTVQSTLSAFSGRIQDNYDYIDTVATALREQIGNTLVTDTIDSSLNHSKAYVYIGTSTTDINKGDWIYYDGTAWKSGGVYNSEGYQTDKTLTVANMAADAEIVGGEIDDLKSAINFSNNGYESVRMLSPFENGAIYDGAIQTYGDFRVANTNLITFTEATQLKIASGFWITISFFVNGTYSSSTSWTANLYNLPANSTVRFSIRRETENTSEIADIGEFTNALTFLTPMGKRMATNESDISSLKTRMTTAETNISAVSTAVVTKGGITASNYQSLGFDSVTDLPSNTIWGIGSDITNTMITDLPIYGLYGQIKKTAGLLPNNIYILYEYTSNNKDRYIAWQNNSGTSLSTWTRISTGTNDSFSPVSARTHITSSSKVIFIGDSIVAGVGGTGWQQTSGRFLLTYDNVDLYANDNGTCWANMMVDYLETNYGCTAYNNGLSGFNSVNIPQNIASLVPSDATHVIACWGINDRAYNYDTVGGYQTVIDYCDSIGAKIVPLTICPCLQPNSTYSHTQYEILTRIKTVCANNNLEVCDLWSAVNNYFYTKGITLDTNYIPDNLHPNDAMYTIMYNLIRSLLEV